MLDEQRPRPAGVRAGRAQMADGDPEHECPVEASMREKYVAARIYGVEHALVETIQFGRGQAQRAWSCAEAHRRERHGREPLEVAMLIHARCKLVRETDVLAQDTAQAR